MRQSTSIGTAVALRLHCSLPAVSVFTNDWIHSINKVIHVFKVHAFAVDRQAGRQTDQRQTDKYNLRANVKISKRTKTAADSNRALTKSPKAHNITSIRGFDWARRVCKRVCKRVRYAGGRGGVLTAASDTVTSYHGSHLPKCCTVFGLP